MEKFFFFSAQILGQENSSISASKCFKPRRSRFMIVASLFCLIYIFTCCSPLSCLWGITIPSLPAPLEVEQGGEMEKARSKKQRGWAKTVRNKNKGKVGRRKVTKKKRQKRKNFPLLTPWWRRVVMSSRISV